MRFSHEFGLIFLWVCGFFEDLLVASFRACFNKNFLVFCTFLFCGLLFFKNLMALLLFQFFAAKLANEV